MKQGIISFSNFLLFAFLIISIFVLFEFTNGSKYSSGHATGSSINNGSYNLLSIKQLDSLSANTNLRFSVMIKSKVRQL